MSQQIMLQGWAIKPEKTPDGGVMLILSEIQPPTGNAIIVPLDQETAKTLGHDLSAPAVAVASAADVSKLRVGR